MLPVLTSLALALGPAPLPAFQPYLVRDISTTVASASSTPRDFQRVGSRAVFVADDGVSGRELWTSDGTAGGTFRLTDACPGACSTSFRFLLSPAGSDRIFFFASDPKNGQSLWVTGGLPGNTVRLASPLLFQSPEYGWLGSRLVFVADDGVHGSELWTSDGTAGGTAMVADLIPGPGQGSYAQALVTVGDDLYFVIFPFSRPALWKTDGTAGGTVEVWSAWPDPGVELWPVGALGGRLLLEVVGENGTETWVSDGTAEGTVPLGDLSPGSDWSRIEDLVTVGGRSYFVVTSPADGQELWSSDGTPAGTVRLTDFGEPEAFFSESGRFLPLPRESAGGPRYLFPAYSDEGRGQELWETDGTPAGTRPFLDLCPGACSGFHYQLRGAEGRFLFAGDDGATGGEPWTTDGTAAGTRRIADLTPGSASSQVFVPGVLPDGRLLLGTWSPQGSGELTLWRSTVALDGVERIATVRTPDRFQVTTVGTGILFGAIDARGAEPWTSDGTAAGTRRLADLATQDLGGSYPEKLMAAGARVLFLANDGVSGNELWVSDGTSPGTKRVTQLAPGAEPRFPPDLGDESVALGNRVFFRMRRAGETTPGLWVSDGTAAGTRRLTPAGVSAREGLAVLGSQVLFTASEPNAGWELWRTDGTVAGTRRLADIARGFSDSQPAELTLFRGRLYFAASTSDGGRELWATNGTTAGTVRIKNIYPDFASSNPARLTVHQGWLYFFAEDGTHGTELWRTDGTAAGTRLFADLAPGPDSSFPTVLVPAGTRLYVFASIHESAAVPTPGLWKSEGGRPVTRVPGFALSPADRPVVVGNRLYFPSWNGSDEVLIQSDGTAAGTRPVLAADGQPVRWPSSLLPVGNRLVFAGYSPEGEQALWQSDGTVAGTRMLRILEGPGESSFTWSLVRAGKRIFFRAYSPDTGRELWAMGTP